MTGRFGNALNQHAKRKVPSVHDIMEARGFPTKEAAEKKAEWCNWGDGKQPWEAKPSGRPNLWVVTKTYRHYDGGDKVTIYLAPVSK